MLFRFCVTAIGFPDPELSQFPTDGSVILSWDANRESLVKAKELCPQYILGGL